MGAHDDRPDDGWADWTAKWTFISLAVLAALYVGSVFLFILR